MWIYDIFQVVHLLTFQKSYICISCFGVLFKKRKSKEIQFSSRKELDFEKEGEVYIFLNIGTVLTIATIMLIYRTVLKIVSQVQNVDFTFEVVILKRNFKKNYCS